MCIFKRVKREFLDISSIDKWNLMARVNRDVSHLAVIIVVILLMYRNIHTISYVDFILLIAIVVAVLIHHFTEFLFFEKNIDDAKRDALTGFLRKSNNLKVSFGAKSVAMLDIDFFKLINDEFGHPAGDSVIREVSCIIRSECLEDTIFRWGGEEFLVVSNKDISDLAMSLEVIRERVNTLLLECVGNKTISISSGVSEMYKELSKSIGHADMALYRAKNTGRNKVELYGQP